MSRNFLSKIIYFAVKIIDKTMRKTLPNDSHYYTEPAIYPFWHGCNFTMMTFNKNSGIVIMVSLSKDGQLIANLLKDFGYNTVRGSSSRRGQAALLEMIKQTKEGYSMAFAADGPKGPYHELKPGLIYLAKKSGFPIVPVSNSAKYKIKLKSWDKMEVPLPFSTAVQLYGAPIYVTENDDIEEKRKEVETELNKIYEFCDSAYWGKDIVRYLELHPFPKILIVQPSRIGDIIFSLPVLAAIRRKYPKARLSWIVDERCAEILIGNPYLENIFIWDRRKRSAKYYKDLKKKLRKEKFDLSIDLHGLAKSAMLVRLAGARHKIASSSTNGMREFSWLVSKEIKHEKPDYAHCIERHMATAKYLNCSSDIEYPIEIPEEAFESVKNKLKRENVDLDKMVGIHPGGGWISRRWDPYKFSVLTNKLKRELGADIILVGGREGGKSEKGLNEEIIADSEADICDMTGKFTLKELCAFLKLCRVFVGNESGPMHIATALNTQAVALLGPTNACRTGPYKGNTRIIQHQVDCQPCRNRNCKNPICMKNITVAEVFEAVREKYENSDN